MFSEEPLDGPTPKEWFWVIVIGVLLFPVVLVMWLWNLRK